MLKDWAAVFRLCSAADVGAVVCAGEGDGFGGACGACGGSGDVRSHGHGSGDASGGGEQRSVLAGDGSSEENVSVLGQRAHDDGQIVADGAGIALCGAYNGHCGIVGRRQVG